MKDEFKLDQAAESVELPLLLRLAVHAVSGEDGGDVDAAIPRLGAAVLILDTLRSDRLV